MVTSLMILMIVFAILAVCLKDLIRSALCLAVTSALLSAIIFLFGMPYAAVFELSVASGLITVLFISTISLVKRPDQYEREIGMSANEEQAQSLFHVEIRDSRFLKWLPILVVIVGVILWQGRGYFPEFTFPDASDIGLADTLWKSRAIDLFGQVVVILCGIFLVTLFFRERKA